MRERTVWLTNSAHTGFADTVCFRHVTIEQVLGFEDFGANITLVGFQFTNAMHFRQMSLPVTLVLKRFRAEVTLKGQIVTDSVFHRQVCFINRLLLKTSLTDITFKNAHVTDTVDIVHVNTLAVFALVRCITNSTRIRPSLDNAITVYNCHVSL